MINQNFLTILIFNVLTHVYGYPYVYPCGQRLTIGQSIMGGASIIDTTNKMVVTRNGVVLSTDVSTYISGETLTVTISSNPGGGSSQYLFQTLNANYVGGACSGINAYANSGLTSNVATLQLPNGGSGDVQVWGGYATSQSTVSVLSTFILKDPGVASPPSLAPVTSAPTATPKPTNIGETFKPSITVTVTPSATPTQAPFTQSATMTTKDYPTSLKTDLVVGFTVGLGGFFLVCLLVYLYISDYTAGLEGRKLWFSHFFSFFRVTPVVPLTAVCLGVISIILVSVWAQNNNTTVQLHYLGEPIWENNANILAWHPLLMVAGFFFCQVVAVCSWSLFSDRLVAKLNHIFFQIVALVTMSFGLLAIVRYKFNTKEPSLVSMHSWIGTAAIALYGVNFCWGFVMAGLTKFHPDSIFRSAFDLGFIHKVIGGSAFNLTVAAILTGITDYLPWTACNYLTNGVTYNGDSNPAQNYGMIPDACQIANGLGVTVFITAILVAFTSAIRAKYSNVSPTHGPLPK